MTFGEYRYLVMSDLYRVTGSARVRLLLRHLLLGGAYRYTFWMRTCRFARHHRLLMLTVYPFARLMFQRLRYQLGISIPFETDIGSGFFIGHFGGIVVSHGSVIGKNCNISQGVTVGKANRGKYAGHPILGDNVYVGPGAKIIGAVRVGHNVAIGANCVVTKDVPDDSVVVGVPGRVISNEGSEGYVNLTDYDSKIRPPGPH